MLGISYQKGRRAFLKTAFAAAAVAALAMGSAQPSQAQEEVRIGSLMGVTGALASYVPPIDAAARMAVRDVNEQGGILDGQQLTIVTGDTRADGRTAAAAANRLINVNNVAGIMGALASGATIAAANTAAIPNGVVMISPASTSPAITTLEDNGNIFRVVPSDAFQGVALASALRERGIDKVAITWINNDYGVGLANAFREAYTAQGGEVAGAQVHEPQKSSYQSELASLARGGAEWLIVIAYANDSGPVIIRQALESDLFSNFIGTDGIRSDDMIAQIGAQNLNGMLFSSPGEVSGTQAEQRFVSAFREFSAESVGKPFAAQGYDATFILALAIQKAGSMDRDAIRAAVTEVASAPGVEILPGQWREAREALANGQDVNYVGATGDHEFDENGDVAGVIDIWQIQDGELVKVQTISD